MVRRAVLVDAVLAAVLTALAVDTVVRTGADSWLAHLLAVLMVAPVAVRQRAPVLATGIMGVAMAAYGLLGHGNTEIPGNGIGMTIGMLTVATLRPCRVAALTFAPTVVATAAYLAVRGCPSGRA
jgi:hypothetical protein